MACDLCTLLAAPPEGVVIWADDALTVVAVDEPGYPGFTRVVWNAHVKEMTDLAPHKVNVASFGNMTPHVHWHVIPRYQDDAHFPNPTWGARQRSIDTNSDAAAVAVRTALLPELHRTIKERLEESHHG